MLYVVKPARKHTVLDFAFRAAAVFFILFLVYQTVAWAIKNFNSFLTFNGFKILLGIMVVAWVLMIGGYAAYSLLKHKTKP